MTLNGDGVGGVKVKLIAKVAPKEHGSVVSFDVHSAARPCSGRSA